MFREGDDCREGSFFVSTLQFILLSIFTFFISSDGLSNVHPAGDSILRRRQRDGERHVSAERAGGSSGTWRIDALSVGIADDGLSLSGELGRVGSGRHPRGKGWDEGPVRAGAVACPSVTRPSRRIGTRAESYHGPPALKLPGAPGSTSAKTRCQNASPSASGSRLAHEPGDDTVSCPAARLVGPALDQRRHACTRFLVGDHLRIHPSHPPEPSLHSTRRSPRTHTRGEKQVNLIAGLGARA